MSAVGNGRSGSLVWTGRAPCGGSLQVRLDERGLWHVTYGGFSRSSSLMLRVALAEASGAEREAAWLASVARQIEAAAG